MTLTWAEDRATLASDPSAVPGAKTEGRHDAALSSFGIGTNALNASLQLSSVQAVSLAYQNRCRLSPPCLAKGCTRLFELRRLSLPLRAEPAAPAHASGYATPPIRSDILSGTLANSGGSPMLRADVTGPCASISAVSSLGRGAWLSSFQLWRTISPRPRRLPPPRDHATWSCRAASPSSAPGVCGPGPRWPASCVSCRHESNAGTPLAPRHCNAT